MRVLRRLAGNPPQTIAELTADLGVTRTAVSDKLNELMAVGLVRWEAEKVTGRGRPRHRYSV